MAKPKYDPDTFPLLAEKYARDGLIDIDIAAKLGIAEATFYVYQNEHKEFSEAIKRGKQPVDIKVENALLKRALGYDYEEKTTEMSIGEDGLPQPKAVKVVKKEIAGDVRAQGMWLTNRRPKEWSNLNKIEHSGEIKTIAQLVKEAKEETEGGSDGES